MPLRFHHDGYDRAVFKDKNKRARNLRLLRTAREEDPDNPRWLSFTVRDALPILDRAQLLDLCATLKDLATRAPQPAPVSMPGGTISAHFATRATDSP